MKNIFLVCILFASIFILTISDFGRHGTIVYDCRDAHWMPDIPIEVKKECAKLFKEEWERRRNEEISKKKLISI